MSTQDPNATIPPPPSPVPSPGSVDATAPQPRVGPVSAPPTATRDAASGASGAPPGAGAAVNPRGRRRIPAGAVLSAVAVLLAAAAVLVAWRALDRANDARDIALAGRAQARSQGGGSGPAAAATPPSSATSASGTAAPSDRPSPPAPEATLSGEAPQLTQRTVYKPKYEKQVVTLKAVCTVMYADLDEPRANVGSGDFDIALRGGCSGRPPAFDLADDVTGSQEGAPTMTPQDCGDKIRTAPLGEGAVPVTKGLVLCVATSFAAAERRGDVRRMVLLEVTGVAADGSVTVQLTAWDIPR